MYFIVVVVCVVSVDTKTFHELVSKLQKFISCRLFPQKVDDLPPMSKCSWWIPSVTKVMALLSKLPLYSVVLLVQHQAARHFPSHTLARYSASTVITATAKINGKCGISTPSGVILPEHSLLHS